MNRPEEKAPWLLLFRDFFELLPVVQSSHSVLT